jgi:hypothetical protein
VADPPLTAAQEVWPSLTDSRPGSWRGGRRAPQPVFEGLVVTTEPVETVVYGIISDQEAVHNLLIKLESLGLEVVEFRRLPASPGDPGAVARPPP